MIHIDELKDMVDQAIEEVRERTESGAFALDEFEAKEYLMDMVLKLVDGYPIELTEVKAE